MPTINLRSIVTIYYSLTKPGIIYSNAIAAAAGFFLASRGHINFFLLLAVLLGTSLIIASGCVFNNYIDRGIDQFMERTKNRALVKKIVSNQHALIFASLLCIFGFAILLFGTNLLTVLIGFIGFVDYVVLYGIWKRRSSYGTIVGSISGATPPVAGYCAVTNHFDIAALLLFIILVLWQMPHFYAIAIYRGDEYAAASIPVLPLKRGIFTTKLHILGYIIAFVLCTTLLTIFKYTGYIYLVCMILIGLIWVGLAIKGFTKIDDIKWARKIFFFSLVVIVVLSIMLAIGPVLP